MAELVKQWNDGGSLSVSYDGDRDGSAVFSSDAYEGIDRTMPVTFKGAGLSIERTVRQEGIRQQFVTKDGKVFCLFDDGRFGVLKSGFEPEEPPTMETYTRLTYIESTGTQYINLGYVVQEDDVLEINYVPTQLESGRLFGTIDSAGNSIFFSFSTKNAYARFGNNKSTIITNGISSNRATIEKGTVSTNTYSASMPFVEMPTTPIYLFAYFNNGDVTAYSYCRCMGFAIRKPNGESIELLPYMRNSDGKAGMLDVISGNFYVNEGGQEDFLMGAGYKFPEGYSLIDGVTFNADKLFALSQISQDDSIDIMFQRSEGYTSQYLYGIVNDGNTASVTAYLSSTGAWRFGNQLVRPNTADKNVHRTTIANAKAYYDCSAMTLNRSVDFKTADSVVLGGYRDAAGALSAQYKGKVFFVRVNNGNTLDWIPCVRALDGVEGFWDCVTKTFIEPV